jgi:hypothetical protein
MYITIKREDAATVVAALILALEARPRGMTAKDIEDTKRLARDIARQVEEAVQ